MIFLYNCLILIIIIFFLPILLLKIFTNKNLKHKFHERLALYDKNFIDNVHNTKIIWIHASSVGEVNVSSLLAKKLKNKLPDYKILITTMTVTGYENAKKNKNLDFVKFVPFDIGFIVKRFFKIITPSLLLIAETEFWPNIFYTADKLDIPLLVFNCRISDSSIKTYLKFKFFFKNILNCADYFLCQNSDTLLRLKTLEVDEKKIIFSKNIKFDINFDIIPKKVYTELNFTNKQDYNIIVAGSTHQGEEEILIEVYKNILSDLPDTILIIAPRHIERTKEISALLQQNNLHYNLLSSYTNENAKVLILDKIGWLVKAYSIATICFIGGSLILRGGHNPLEALYFKKPVISGRNIFNFREIYKKLEQNNGVIFATNEYEIENQFRKLLSNKNYRERIALNGYKILEENRGATAVTVEYILKCLS